MSDTDESTSNSPIHDIVAGESSNKRHEDPDVADIDENKDDDNESTSPALSDPDTDELLSVAAADEGTPDDNNRPLGLSRPWGFSKYNDYE